MSWRRDSGRSLMVRRGLMSSQPIVASSSSERRSCARRSMRPSRRGGSVMQMLSATVRSGISDSSWKTQTMPFAIASRGARKAASLPSISIRPEFGRDDAADDLDQCALARAVLAEDGVDRLAADRESHVVERDHAAIALAHIGKRKQRVFWPRASGHHRSRCQLLSGVCFSSSWNGRTTSQSLKSAPAWKLSGNDVE